MHAFVIVGASLRLTPYAFPYIYELLLQGFSVTTIGWNRDGKSDIMPNEKVRVVHYDELLDDAAPKYKKLFAFSRFRRAVLKVIREEKPDFIVVLDTQFAVLFSDILLKKYRDKFVYDMRDPSYERFTIYRKRVAKIVEASSGVFISSDGYRQYLPKSEKIYTTHNLRTEDLKERGLRNQYERIHLPIRISFWGCVRDTEINLGLIDALANDNRFILQYFGTMSEDSSRLVEYCQTKGIENVTFHGPYLPNERYEFVKETEIIHNVYSNCYESKNPCMGNKYYDALIFGLPQLCTKGGFMGELAEKHGIGIAPELNSNFGDTLWHYYHTINWDAFNVVCDSALKKVLDEYDAAASALREIITHIRSKNQ